MAYLTVEEVGERLKVSSYTVKRWLREGELAGVRLGRNGPWRTTEDDVRAFLKESKSTKTVAA
jgi:excisionase family DNA binding protein